MKVGAKVRSKVSQFDVKCGREYEVVSVHENGSVRVRDDVGDEYCLLAGEFEEISRTQAESAFDLLAAITGTPLKFRSGCDVKFIAYSPDARPHCQLVLLNPSTGNIVTRYANGKASDEPHSDPGDILVKEAA
ncbi:hypothetical protein [Burkholderia ambifaria]|uniref:hypothetical protein n=1 Tax=Burkholderia ambifaria TaxID=152480 RepID=UPI0039E47C41